MGESSDAKFVKIINEALEAARRVRCSTKAYREGLQAIIDEVQTELDAAEETAGEGE